MLIGTAHNTLRFGNLLAIRIDDHLIKRVNKTKYLGIIVDDSLTWNQQIDFISTRFKRNVGMMKRVRDSIPKDSSITLYKSLVEPYLDTVTLCGVNVENLTSICYKPCRKELLEL